MKKIDEMMMICNLIFAACMIFLFSVIGMIGGM